MQHFQQNENTPNHTEKTSQEILEEKMQTHVAAAFLDNPDTLQSIQIIPSMGTGTMEELDAILQRHSLNPVERVLSCGFIYLAEINLDAALELCAHPSVSYIHENWLTQSF